MERAVRVFTEHVTDYIRQSADRVVALEIPAYINLPRTVLEAAIGRAFATILVDIENQTCSAYPEYMRQAGLQRAQNGVQIREMISGLDHGFQVVTDSFAREFLDDLPARLWWETRRCELSYAGALAVMDAFYTAREAIIADQNRMILRLAAPIVPIHDGVLLMPLVGTITAERAAHILESRLQGIARQRSSAVILDVTGLHVEDEGAMDHLLQAARAARLLGATVILVGISAESARILTKTGADLHGITIRGDLKSGVEHALRLVGRIITKLS
jgi:rsbT co-antagonist protein RsbR